MPWVFDTIKVAIIGIIGYNSKLDKYVIRRLVLSNYLNPENGFFSMLSKVFDLIVLNLIYVLMNLPFVLAVYINLAMLFNEKPSWHPLYILVALLLGFVLVPSSTALYYAVVKAVRRHRGYPLQEFFRSFKQNFKQGVGASYIFVVLAGFLVFDFWYALQVFQQEGGVTYFFLFVVIAFFLVSTFMYYCPVLSRFQMKQWNALKFSLGLAARHMGYTVLIIFMWLAFGILGYFTRGLTLFVLLAVGVLVESFMMEKVLKKYVLKTLEQQEEQQNVQASAETADIAESEEVSFNFKRLDAEEAKEAGASGKKKKHLATDDEWYLE